MTNKVKLKQVVDFINAATSWMRAHQNNPTSPLGLCINSVMPSAHRAITPLNDIVAEYNKKVSELKVAHADNVEITENSQAPDHAITKYSYSKDALVSRNQEIQKEWDAFIPQRDAVESSEVEIEVNYVRSVPDKTTLPTEYVTVFRGIVIDPAYDPNLRIIQP